MKIRNAVLDDHRSYVDRLLGRLLSLYLAASLLHFAHNAEYLQDYPNLPGWISRSGVYWAWAAISAAGVGGYLLYRPRRYGPGLILLAVSASAGLDGLLHYAQAPMAAHTHLMNFTLWFEVVVAATLLTCIFILARSHAFPPKAGTTPDR